MLVDANLLIYAADRDAPEHEGANGWLTDALNGSRRVGIPWSSFGAYLRLGTHPRIFGRPRSPAEAWRDVEEWIDAPATWIPEPGPGYRAVLSRVIAGSRASGDLIPDAMLAALAIEHGLTLQTTDSDFGRFDGLSWANPLRAG